MKRILVVDDQADIHWVMENIFKENGFEVDSAKDVQQSIDKIIKNPPSVILMDIKTPEINILETLEKIKQVAPQIPIIIMTAYGDIKSAVKVMKHGAYDYLTKPFDNEEILFTVKRALEKVDLSERLTNVERRLEMTESFNNIIGKSPKIQKVIQQVKKIADTNFTVLIQGETGTGKEVVAREIHKQSKRNLKPFIAVDCGSIPDTLIESELFGYEKGAFTGAMSQKEGYFELASGGTLFLDEISNLPFVTQSKLLRIIQERVVRRLGAKKHIPIDTRIIVASNMPLEKEVELKRFRLDLFHRINEFPINVPPLRERKEDIPLLTEHFLYEVSLELKKKVPLVSEKSLEVLLSYPWPGNVRELKNITRRTALLSEEIIEPYHLHPLMVTPYSSPSKYKIEEFFKGNQSLKDICNNVINELEKEIIEYTLRSTEGNKSKAAKILKIDYKTLHYKIKNYGIRVRDFIP